MAGVRRWWWRQGVHVGGGWVRRCGAVAAMGRIRREQSQRAVAYVYPVCAGVALVDEATCKLGDAGALSAG